jgi:hypothetical protein
MRILTNLIDTDATDALIGRLPIDARHYTKWRVISQAFVPRERYAQISPGWLLWPDEHPF